MAQDKKVISVLNKISKAIGASGELDEMFRAVTKETTRLFPADICSVMLLDPARGELVVQDAAGLSRWETETIRFKVGEGIAGWVARTAKPARVADVAKDKRFRAVPGQRSRIVSLLCVPLLAKGKVFGVVTLTNRAKKGAFAPADEAMLTLLASHISLNVENHRLSQLSATDSLTGLYNHAHISRRVEEELASARRYHESVTILMFDLDHFKTVNDTYGHPAGDKVLLGVADMLRRNIRESDIAGRYGGEEFTVILPQTRKPGGAVIAERLRKTISEAQFPLPQGNVGVTVSVGLSNYPEDAMDAAEVIDRADQALYQAKAAGRNRVHTF